MTVPHLHLISFPICPYVQRSVIMLKHKQVPYDITYIDLKNPPEWFLEKSPTGKVPLLIVDQETVVFESAVISEYIDEITPPPIMPTDPLQRAQARAWIAFMSEHVGAWHKWATAKTEAECIEASNMAAKGFARLETQCKAGPFFAGAQFSLLDATLAPLILRFLLLPDDELNPWKPEQYPQLQRWWNHVSQLPEVKQSVRDDFSERLGMMVASHEGFASQRLKVVVVV